MFRNIIFYTLSTLSMAFLFVSPGPIFNYSSFVFYALSGAALFIVLAFFFYYRSYFSKTVEKQLEVISELPSNNWSSWLSKGSPYLTRIFAASTPYTIGVASISNCMYLWFNQLNFIRYIAIVLLAIQGILMLMLLLTICYNILFGRSKQASEITLN